MDNYKEHSICPKKTTATAAAAEKATFDYVPCNKCLIIVRRKDIFSPDYGLMYMYEIQVANVKWNNFYSMEFNIKNGVKQGAVLSAKEHNLTFSTNNNANKCKTKCMAFLKKERNFR